MNERSVVADDTGIIIIIFRMVCIAGYRHLFVMVKRVYQFKVCLL